MREGLKLTNPEIAAIYDVMNLVRIEGCFHLETQELEVLEKLEIYIAIVENEWEQLSDLEKFEYLNQKAKELVNYESDGS